MRVPNFTPFRSTIARVPDQIIRVWGFSIGDKIQSLNIGNSKCQKSPTQFCEDHFGGGGGGIQEKFENYWLWYVGVALWNPTIEFNVDKNEK